MLSLTKIKNLLDILIILTKKELVVKYKGTYFGYIWSIAHPLMLAIVFYIGFKIVMKVNIPDYTLFLLTALFPWQSFVNSVISGTWSFVMNASLIKKMNFPKFLLPLSNVLVDMYHLVISLPIIIIMLIIYHKQPFHLSWIIFLPLLFLFQTILSFSFALIFGTLNLFYRDIDRLVSLLMTLIMYISPIFYSMEFVPEHLKKFFYLNPLVPLINMWRDVFYYGTINEIDLVACILHIIFWGIIAFLIYKKFEIYFAERS